MSRRIQEIKYEHARVGLSSESKTDERVEREGRVANPRESVIPVARTYIATVRYEALLPDRAYLR